MEDNRYIELLYADSLTAGMLDFVRDMLEPVNALSKTGRHLPFRSRFAHTKRVLGWVFRIAAAEGGDLGILTAAAIFHDVGYCVIGEGHALRSADIFRSYMAGFSLDTATESAADGALSGPAREISRAVRRAMSDEASVERIIQVIAEHSAKQLSNGDLQLESRILMDADMLDEAGAMNVLWDCFLETASPAYDYDSAYDRLNESFRNAAPELDHFHTAEGRGRYAEMRGYIGQFLDGLKTELNR